MNDGATDEQGNRKIVRCSECAREYEAGEMKDRPGRRCLVDGAALFPSLDRGWGLDTVLGPCYGVSEPSRSSGEAWRMAWTQQR